MKWLLLICVISYTLRCNCQNAIFKGGNSDGFAVGCYAQADVILNNAIFKGGNNDGFAIGCYAQADVILNNAIFKGGVADGFSIGCYAQADVILNNAIFKGGNNDGFAIGCYAQADVILNNAIFKGGNADGFAVGCYAQADLILNNAIFKGGNSDGFSIGCYAQTDVILNNAIFKGGIADGFAFGSYRQVDDLGNLPIELISFIGECLNKNIQLKWSTATESNNDYFTIEQSTDALNWVLTETIDGAGNSLNLLHYSFSDTKVHNGISYYRLKQTDFNKQFKYSDIITVEDCGEEVNEFIIYPNPSSGILNFSFNGDKEHVYSIETYNTLGEIVNHTDSSQLTVNLSNNPEGVYFVHFILDSKTITKKIVIER